MKISCWLMLVLAFFLLTPGVLLTFSGTDISFLPLIRKPNDPTKVTWKAVGVHTGVFAAISLLLVWYVCPKYHFSF